MTDNIFHAAIGGLGLMVVALPERGQRELGAGTQPSGRPVQGPRSSGA